MQHAALSGVILCGNYCAIFRNIFIFISYKIADKTSNLVFVITP